MSLAALVKVGRGIRTRGASRWACHSSHCSSVSLRRDFSEGVKNVVDTRDFIGSRLPLLLARRTWWI